MKKTVSKHIIIAIPDHFGLPERFDENLKFLGFSTFLIKLQDKKIKLNFKDKVIHGFKKLFLNDKTHKSKISADFHCKKIVDWLETQNYKYDYALIIRPDLASENLLKTIREKSEFFCAYQWDGLDRYQMDEKFLNYFDRFFVFDKNDLIKNKNFLPLTNFYFDNFKPTERKEFDLFFVGTYQPKRISKILSLAETFNNIGLKTYINILGTKEKTHSPFVNFSDEIIDYKQNIENVLKSEIILDIKNPVHEGFSLRILESIGYKKKLITDNKLVKKHDFYNENNIFILENNFTPEELKTFVQKPYQQLDEKVYKKYAFTNWINYILEIHPNIPLK